MSTQTRLMTADEFLEMPDDGLRHELIRGEVVTMSLPGGEHGKIALEDWPVDREPREVREARR